MKLTNKLATAIALGAFAIVSCNPEESTTKNLTLDFDNLESLGTDYQYEGWIMVDGSPVTTGTFTLNDNGEMSQSSFELDVDQLDNATAFILTIEPSPDPDPSPSDVHVVAGDFSGDNASLNIEHQAALGNDFKNASGSYIIATPTDGGMETNEESGIWFLDPSGPAASLDLPTLPAGWTYEGWGVINGVPVSTGTFLGATGSDNSAVFSGSAGAPPFPGEDFLNDAPDGLTFPTSMANGAVVISIEPVPDNSPAPFTLKPLFHGVSSSPETHMLTPMENNIANTMISGSASR